jgi:hypothetical protein
LRRPEMKLACSALIITFATLAHPAIAQQNAGANRAVDIYAIIDSVADDVGKEFIVDPSIRTTRLPTSQEEFNYVTRPQAYTTSDEVSYESLRALLRTIEFVAIESDDQVRIVPASFARAEPSRILQQDDSRVSDHEIVTRTITIPDSFEAGDDAASRDARGRAEHSYARHRRLLRQRPADHGADRGNRRRPRLSVCHKVRDRNVIAVAFVIRFSSGANVSI